jgi:1,4-alpha-glucan branching enzyme
MIKRYGHILVLVVLLLGSISPVMAQDHNNLRITEDDHLLLQIDLQSSKKTLDSILRIAGVTAKPEALQKGDFAALIKDHWRLVSHQNDIVQFDRSLNELNNNPPNSPYEISLEIPQIDGKPGYPANVKYGVNRYSKITVYQLPSGLTRFMLPGFTNVKRVFLAGNFNSWSTLKSPMQKTDGGWIIDVKLEPGIYQYKYIIGGRWSTDPNNRQTADDGAGNVNSVYYKYNYIFRLKGHTDAHRVIVTGDFNDWNTKDLIMDKTGDGWQKELYLGDGKHKYLFMVDGKAIPDPTNPVQEKNENESLESGVNSVITLGEIIHFKLKGYAEAGKVFVAGNFNNWNPNEFRLKKTKDGWALPMVLSAGNYGYRFIVDGNWMQDPQNPNSVVENGQENSFIAVKPNYTFRLKGHSDARSVKLSGTFLNWDPNGYTMKHVGDEWVISLNLKPGKYLYKFIVDGEWILDPGNEFWERNAERTGNSVLWIE